jgi:RNA polymerase sigma factor (sigma-70 family)
LAVDLTDLSDEALAAKCAEGVDAAERELLGRHMQAIYWLPRRHFGASEDDLGEFLLYAVEKLRERDTLSRYDPEAGASFKTWFGVVIRNLYLDYLRRLPPETPTVPLEEELQPAPPPEEPANEDQARAEALLARLEIKCRALFKMLLANSFYLTGEEMRWIAEQGGRTVAETARLLAEIEEDLRGADAAIEERRRRLDAVYWWKRLHEQELAALERHGPGGRDAEMERVGERLRKRREQYARLVDELAGGGGLATTPYRRLAEILNMKEGTLGSHLTRCRQGAARLLATGSGNPDEERPDREG